MPNNKDAKTTTTTHDLSEDFIHLGFICKQISLLLYDALEPIYAKYELDFRQAGILFMGLSASLSQTHIAKLARTDKNTIGVMIDSLQERGLLERKQNPKNRKENLILLTKKGQNLALKLQKDIAKAQKEALGILPQARYSELCEGLSSVYQHLRANPRKIEQNMHIKT